MNINQEHREMEGEKNNVTNEIMYKECLKNHAASLGSYATDGCGEFTLDDTNSLTGGSLNCAACGCHRNFHHKVTHGKSRTMAHSPDFFITYITHLYMHVL
ncbi:hypothetical protein ACJIZ3_010124 [Penstemon smallii]|uniref:ZF-HD dimerization-type domain-containing protein n=1 Tax=Penstemon smallii TaxID=265156 RepID=A0ABD3TFT8_9LAMI